MDPLKFRPRRLFRAQAIANFVGAFGDGTTPELLFRGYGWRLLAASICLSLLAIYTL